MENETSSSEPWLRRRVAELEAENRRLQERLRLEQAARANATRDAVAAYQMQTMLQTELAHAQLDSGELEEYAEELMLVSQSLAEATGADASATAIPTSPAPPPSGSAPSGAPAAAPSTETLRATAERSAMAACDSESALLSRFCTRMRREWREHSSSDPAPPISLDDPVVAELLDNWRDEPDERERVLSWLRTALSPKKKSAKRRQALHLRHLPLPVRDGFLFMLVPLLRERAEGDVRVFTCDLLEPTADLSVYMHASTGSAEESAGAAGSSASLGPLRRWRSRGDM